MSVLSRLGISASILDFEVKRFFRGLIGVGTIAAAGADQAGATAITTGKVIVTAADGAKGVRLPVAELDMAIEVINTEAAQDLLVYPNTGAAINAGSANDPFTVVGGASRTFFCDAALHWYVGAGNLTGTATTASTAELNALDSATDANDTTGKVAILGTDGALTIGGAFTAVGTIGIGSAVLSETEMEMLDGITPGTGLASKALVLDAGDDLAFPAAGVLTIGNIATAVEAAEHGVGAIGTAVAPATYRWIEHGVIVTQIKIDLTGLASVNDADDVIGLAAGGAAYIGRNVVATNGVIFKAELACLETPAGGDNDIDLKTSSSAVAAYDTDGAAFGSVFNSGDWVAGTCRQNLVPALTANDYFYLTAGTGDTADTYTAGMYVLTLYGHPALA